MTPMTTPIVREFPCLADPETAGLLRSLHDIGPGAIADLALRSGLRAADVSWRLLALRTEGLAEFIRPSMPQMYRVSVAGVLALRELEGAQDAQDAPGRDSAAQGSTRAATA